MKIVSLEAENIKRLKAVSITPDGSMVQLTGKNAQGKTSVLDSIYMALKVTGLGQEKPVRAGEEKGMIRLDLGEILVVRKFKFDKDTGETTTSITVTAADGAKYPGPQGMLDSLLSSLTFDPLAFSRMDPAGQVNAVRSLLPGIDFDGVAASNKADYDTRTELNRKIRDLDGEIKAMPPKAAIAPKTVDKSELLKKLTQASDHNALIETKKANRASANQKIEENKERVKEIAEEIAVLQKESETLLAWNKEKAAAIVAAGELPEQIDTAAVAADIEKADEANKAYEKEQLRASKQAELKAVQVKSDALTKAIDDRKASLAAQIAKAELPVDGLSFSDDGILLNGIPFNQASDAEQLRTSCAIVMRQNPKLRVIRVRDGSLLDEDGMALLQKMAEENDFQVWIERVDNSGNVGFVIEDGMVKEAK